MKPLQYVKKYRLDETRVYDREAFMADFVNDFLATVEVSKSHTDFNLTHWENLVRQSRAKFDGIVNKSKWTPEEWEGTWKYFYATVVVKMRDQLFGEVLRKKREARERRRREEDEWWRSESRWSRQDTDDWFDSIFGNFLSFFRGLADPVNEFAALGLPMTATEGEIKDRFREMALSAHSDKGGSDEEMRTLIEARNKCLAYAHKGSKQ